MIDLRLTKHEIKTIGIYFVIGILILSFVFIRVYQRFTWKPTGATFTSILTGYEYEAIDFIKNNVSSNARIISDPFTMRLFTSLTNRQWLLEHLMNPIGFSEEGKQTVRIIREKILLAQESRDAYNFIQELKDVVPYDEEMFLELSGEKLSDEFIVVVSGRTAHWLDVMEDIGTTQHFPYRYNVKLMHLQVFHDYRFFDLIFEKNRQIYIFAVKQEPDESIISPIKFLELTQKPWRTSNTGTGSYEAELQMTVDNSSSYFQIHISNGSYANWAFIQDYSTPTSVLEYDTLEFMWKGQHTNKTFRVSIDGPSQNDRTIYLFKDDASTWVKHTYELQYPHAVNGSPDLGAVVRIIILPHLEGDVVEGVFGIKDLRLYSRSELFEAQSNNIKQP